MILLDDYKVSIHDEISIKCWMVAIEFSLFLKKLMWHIKIKMMKSNTSKISSTYWTNFWFIQKVSIIHASKINSLANFVFQCHLCLDQTNFLNTNVLIAAIWSKNNCYSFELLFQTTNIQLKHGKVHRREVIFISKLYILLNINRCFPYYRKLYRKWTKCCYDNDTMNWNSDVGLIDLLWKV